MRRTLAVYIGGFEFKSWPGGQLPCLLDEGETEWLYMRPLIPSSEVGGVCTRVAQKVLKPLIYFSQNQQEVCAIFLVADFEYPAGCCSTGEQHISLHMHRGLSKWHGMVMCILNNVLVNQISCGREEISNDHSEAVKNICGVSTDDDSTVSC